MSLFDNLNIFCDVATNHHGDLNIFDDLFTQVIAAGAIPKIQLWSPDTFNRKWVDYLRLYPNQFVPSVFRPADVDFIMPYKPLALKVASVESTHWELIRKCMETELPLIVSTGGMDEDELIELIELVGGYPQDIPVCLMHCVSTYPTKGEDLNLGRLTSMAEAIDDLGYDIELGFSSHYPLVAPMVITMAYCFGATQFEVHVRHPMHTSDTPDEQCALTPAEVREVRSILEDCLKIEGSDEIVGPDRDFVVAHRARWQV